VNGVNGNNIFNGKSARPVHDRPAHLGARDSSNSRCT
jgi:hypothetical protein